MLSDWFGNQKQIFMNVTLMHWYDWYLSTFKWGTSKQQWHLKFYKLYRCIQIEFIWMENVTVLGSITLKTVTQATQTVHVYIKRAKTLNWRKRDRKRERDTLKEMWWVWLSRESIKCGCYEKHLAKSECQSNDRNENENESHVIWSHFMYG